MSSKWIPMFWKNKDQVYVNKRSWNAQSTLVKYKYELGTTKIYKGSRSNLTRTKGTKTKATPKDSSSTPQNDETQKINDFLTIATHANAHVASSLLRNAHWDVQNALEFYFKHESQINNTTKLNKAKTKTKVTKKGRSKPSDIKYGKAGTRTEHQKKLVKEKFDELYASFSDHEIICFTDGACSGNPGPAGSGMIVLYGKKSRNTIEKSLALGRHTNNISELYAIGLSIHIVRRHPSSDGWIRKLRATNGDNKIMIRILSDSQYSIGMLSKEWKVRKNVELIKWIKRELNTLRDDGFIVTFHWVGGHSGIEYNERVDSLAQQGAEGAKKGKHVDITQPPNLFLNESNANVPLKRRKKRKLSELSDLIGIRGRNGVKRRRLNVELEDNGNTNVKDSKHNGTPPQSPTIL